jgi:hypothetical protein
MVILGAGRSTIPATKADAVHRVRREDDSVTVESLIEQKEQLIRKLQGEVEVLRAAAKILAQEGPYASSAASAQPQPMPTTMPRAMASTPTAARADVPSEISAVAKQFL